MPPSTLIANSTGSGVQLSWKDMAYNEDSFQVYRSTTQASGYTRLSTLGINATSYLDTVANSNTQYYYKVLASNSNGNSAYSNIAGILTTNRIPVLNPIGSIVLKGGTQLTVPVVAKDDATDHVTLTASGFPSFVTFTDNGNGTGSFLIKPTTGGAGYYRGITVTAKDNSDSTSTTSFTITVTDANSSSVYLNFSDGSLADKPWNNLSGWPFPGTVFNNISDDDNNVTGISVTLVDGFQGIAAEGMRPGNNKGVYPDVVMRTAEFDSSTSAKKIKISGLSTTKKYNFIFFNSHQDGLKGTTIFTINGQNVTLDAAYNISNTVQINGIAPDASGVVTVSVAKASGADYAYISSMIIQGYSNTASLLTPTGLTVTDHKRTSVSLSWTDKSFDETGFEIWRADSTTGAYKLVKTVTANTTSYTDPGLTQNKTYYYMVRAINNSGHSDYSNAVTAYTLAYAVYINFTTDYIASAPWNNTLVPPQTGYVWNNFVDEAGYKSGMSLTELNEFAGIIGSGAVTGNNSGVVPDAVIAQSFGLFPGQTGNLKLSGLNLTMSYDLTFFASHLAWGDVNVGYTVNGKTVLLDASLNNKGTVTLYGVVPDANGEIVISVAPGTPTSQFGLINGLIVQGYTESASAVPGLSQSAGLTQKSQKAQLPAQKATAEIQAYPNPFSSSFNLSIVSPQADNINMQMYNVSGRLVYQNKFDNIVQGANTLKIQINNNPLAPGVYIIKIIFHNQNLYKTLKIIKE